MSTYSRILLRKNALGPNAEAALKNSILLKRGVKSVEIETQTEWSHETKKSEPTGWRYLIVRGTELSVRKAKELAIELDIAETDPNADHDHERCIASARAMGVPASWAHRPETYLSM